MNERITEENNFWTNFGQAFKKLDALLKKSKTKHVNSSGELAAVEEFKFLYFRELRASILNKKLDTTSMDAYFEELQSISSKRTLRASYIHLMKKIQKKFLELEIQKEYSISTVDTSKVFSISEIESKIHLTLEKIDPAIAGSYMQLLTDISDKNKISFKGTVHELREVLREVLARLAPDNEILQSKDFKLEKDCSKPTMKQKVLFIFKQREGSKDDIDAVEKSVKPIELGEEAVAGLARNVYTSGSTSAHTNSTESIRGHVVQLKMYLDAVLCHLLEIHR